MKKKKIQMFVEEPVYEALRILSENNSLSVPETVKYIIREYFERKQIRIDDNKNLKIDHEWFDNSQST